MRCAKAKGLFSSYLENEMDASTSVQFEKHLAECARCKSEYDRFSAAVMMLDEVAEVDPPECFHASVMARVEQLRSTAPRPVKWWQIDWQHVFMIRVPARAAAMATAAILLVAVLVQVTPVGTGVMNMFGLQKVGQTSIGDDVDTAPPWQLSSGTASYEVSGSGMLIGVTSEVEESERVYALRLRSAGENRVSFDVRADGKTYAGSVVRNQDSIIHIPVDSAHDLVVAQVRWTFDGVRHSQHVFLPQRFDQRAHVKRLSMTFQDMTTEDILGQVAQQYGVVILASGDLSRKVVFAEVKAGNPAEALFHGVEELGGNMKQKVLAPSVYVVEPAK